MSVIFDGREFASAKQNEPAEKVSVLKKRGVTPKLVSIIVGEDPASVLYVGLKKKAAERIGCELWVVSCGSNTKKEEIIQIIQKYNRDKTVHGIMVQLPLPEVFSRENRDEILEAISADKDVDGLKKSSKFLTPVVKAVVYALNEGLKSVACGDGPCKLVVVGATGFEGRRIVKELKKDDRFEIEGADSKTKDLRLKTSDSDIVISATGVPGLIKKDMLKGGSIVIDVGSPKGDVEKDAYDECAFVSPVPGGIGPVTIACLLENLVDAASG